MTRASSQREIYVCTTLLTIEYETVIYAFNVKGWTGLGAFNF